jgi:DeoR family fructose operon transcriptional repressor
MMTRCKVSHDASMGQDRWSEALSQSNEGDGEFLLPASRHQRLLEVMHARGEVTVAELTSMFGVSRDTVRRDLYLLEQRGLLNRTHGGALPVDELVGRVTRFQQRVNARTTAKHRIARAAAALIQNGESLILNGGSTTCAFAAELGHLRDLTIVTNNMMLPACIPPQVARSVYMMGGEYWDGAQITVGSLRSGTAKPISVDTAVVGFTGVSGTGLSIGRLE